MAVRVEPTAAGDLEPITKLLGAAFGAPPDAALLNPDLLRWKYLQSERASHLPRSYVLRQGDDIVAHCGVVPLTLRVPGQTLTDAPDTASHVSAICFLDWAGDRRLPGAGVILMKKLMALADVFVATAGSDATRAVIPKLGFKPRQTVDLFARVIRPFEQARSRPLTTPWRDGLRLVRNTAWSLSPSGRLEDGWRAARTEHFSELKGDTAAKGVVAPTHSPEYLNYWLSCPAATISGFHVYQKDVEAGYFLLSRIGRQCRVADFQLRSESPSDLEMAYRLAIRTAAQDRETCEVVCIGSTDAVRTALRACGLRPRGAAPLSINDRHGLLPDAAPLLWSMIDDDTAYVYDSLNPFIT